MRKTAIFILIVVVCGALDIALHALTAGFLSPLEEYSVLVQRFGFETVALSWVVFAFTGMGLVFLRFERRMVGSGLSKGLRYGLAVGLIVQVAMIEGVAMFGNRFIDEFVTGLADAIPIVLMGALLGRFLADDNPPPPRTAPQPMQAALIIVLFAILYAAGRIAAQMAGVFDSALDVRPMATVAWTVAMGATIGVFYLLLQDAVPHLPSVLRALALGLGVFGVNWALFMAFVPMVYPGALVDATLRVSVDILLVVLICLVAQGRPEYAPEPAV